MQFLKQIDTLFRTGTAGGLTDGQLLERFLERRGEDAEAAFAALVDRHGAMVLRVCRQVLRDETDAEDAAQATFLVLARRARSISRRDSVGCWLHGVALRVAANARTAAARRRIHELQGAEMRTAGHVVDAELKAIEEHDDWAKLHDELNILPRSFREPLVLCYLEGLTQEQAAAHLRCPLGTVQSRLARGRAKLKSGLEKRGLSLAPAFSCESHLGLQSCPAPQAWAEATVKLAMQFTHGNGSAIAGASAAAIGLAEEVARAIIMTKLKITAAMIFCAAILCTGAAAWAMHEREADAPIVATNFALPPRQPEPEPVQAKAPAPPERVMRTIRGTVRDEQGRPVAKAWVGARVMTRKKHWEAVEPFDRVRERKEPFRDEHGTIVPAGAPGKYFELRDQDGKWQPIHPADVKAIEKPASPFDFVDAPSSAANKRGDLFWVNAVKGHWEMLALDERGSLADRTDSQGAFLFEFRLDTEVGAVVHFASPDFSRQAIHSVRHDDPVTPVEITLRPLREVRARLFETPRDLTDAELEWGVYAVDPTHGRLHQVRSLGENGACWVHSWESASELGSRGVKRRLEARLPAGHYKVDISSDTVGQIVDLVVPPGEAPLDLPDIRLDSLAWVKMLGGPAAEIDATDLDGRPFKLADYRGKVVVLAFRSGMEEPEHHESIRDLIAIHERFKGQPLEVVALHDTSLASLADLRKTLAPIRDQIAGEMPIRFLRDRQPNGSGTRSFEHRAGEAGSGRTYDIYGVSSLRATFVIDKQGKLVFALNGTMTFAIDKRGDLDRGYDTNLAGDEDANGRALRVRSLEIALEDQLGLPRSAAAKQQRPALPPEEKMAELSVLKGTVVDLEGRPIPGANVTEGVYLPPGKAVKTGPNGEFVYPAEKETGMFDVRIEATGYATRLFKFRVRKNAQDQQVSRGHALIEPTGVITDALIMGPGVAVTGRVMRNGKPVVGVTMALKQIDHDFNPDPLHAPESKTDAAGYFRFPHVLPENEFWACAALGSLADGGAIIPLRVETAEDDSTLDLGEFHVDIGRKLAGRVLCSDGKDVPGGLLLVAGSPNASGMLEQKLGPSGQFAFAGLPDGPVSVHLFHLEKSGYRLSAKNKCLDPISRRDAFFEGQLEHDIGDFTILLEPGSKPESDDNSYSNVDPAVLADFLDATAGPITGVPPRP